jgi:hypothetical protein
MSSFPATCQISIHGSFDRRWSDYLGDLLLDMDVQEGRINTTTFSGHLPDLAAFIGLLNLFTDRGYAVIACEYRQSSPLEMEESVEAPQLIGTQP